MAESRRSDWQVFVDEQFDIQLVIEELSPEDLRERAGEIRLASVRAGQSQGDRITFTMRVFAAILRSPVLSSERQEDLQNAWLEGFGVSLNEFSEAMARR